MPKKGLQTHRNENQSTGKRLRKSTLIKSILHIEVTNPLSSREECSEYADLLFNDYSRKKPFAPTLAHQIISSLLTSFSHFMLTLYRYPCVLFSHCIFTFSISPCVEYFQYLDDAIDQKLRSLNSILQVVLSLIRELFILSSTFTVTP